MKTVSNRDELNTMRGIRPTPAPLPIQPTKPDAIALVVEAALRENVKQFQELTAQGADNAAAMRTIAVAVARALKRPDVTIEAEIERDKEGRMSRIIITRKSEP